MGIKYQQLSLGDRCAIARLHGEGRSLRQIAAALDRAPPRDIDIWGEV
jgi:IS30 family transposase